MALPESVQLCECWPRDGLQSIPEVVSTANKISMIDALTAAGVTKIEVTSFSNPKNLPQFADGVDVLRGITRRAGVSHVVLMPNEKGFDRFAACVEAGHGAEEMILMISSSEAHNLINFRMDHAQAMRAHAGLMARARDLGVRVIGCPGTVYGCPIAGDVPMEAVLAVTRFYVEEGADTIMLGDTTGAANPLLVRRRIGTLLEHFPDARFIAHFHDTRGNGIVNTIAALELGLRFVDTSIGAIGGQPSTGARKYQEGNTGNTCTEDLVALLHEMGVLTGIDLDALIAVGHRAEAIIGRPLRANVIHSGPVNHEARAYDPAAGVEAVLA